MARVVGQHLPYRGQRRGHLAFLLLRLRLVQHQPVAPLLHQTIQPGLRALVLRIEVQHAAVQDLRVVELAVELHGIGLRQPLVDEALALVVQVALVLDIVRRLLDDLFQAGKALLRPAVQQQLFAFHESLVAGTSREHGQDEQPKE
ncbi:hypothetical protein D3C72_1384770 [compost metagenome]